MLERDRVEDLDYNACLVHPRIACFRIQLFSRAQIPTNPSSSFTRNYRQ